MLLFGKNNVFRPFSQFKRKCSIFVPIGKMPCVAPGYSQTSCFNIPLESALYKLQNAHKNRLNWRPLEICDSVNSNGVSLSLYFIRIYFIVMFACKRVRYRDAACKCDKSNYDGVLDNVEKHWKLGQGRCGQTNRFFFNLKIIKWRFG